MTKKLTWADVTPKEAYLNRRQIMAGAGGLALGSIAGAACAADAGDLVPTAQKDVTSYNNFYEFGTDKADPERYAGALTTAPWTVEVDGLVDKPGTYDLGDLMSGLDIEERIYRFRCVEAWSMVIPWNGFQLSALLDKIGVQPSAKYVAFETLYRPEEMRGQRQPILEWPYREGLRLDEAMNPLTLMATGLYGESLLGQNGAPLRLVVPWKYGFKSIKSIVRISLVADEPYATWANYAPNEYGFYANVNPSVDHPRWSQATERVIGSGIFAPRAETLMFNGYADEVAHMYDGMDLTKFY